MIVDRIGVAMDAYLEDVLAGRERLLMDGAMGTMLGARGVSLDGKLELLNMTDPDMIADIHRLYVEAGSQAVTTNTFCAHARYLGADATPEQVFQAAVGCARSAGARYVAADMGPLREFVEPLGPISKDEAYELFARQAKAAQAAGADFAIIETMFDITEACIAVRAVRENSDLPVFATMAFSDGGKTMFGVSPRQSARALVEAGAMAIGANCALPPAGLRPLVRAMREEAPGVPTIVQANAGLPEKREEGMNYPVDALSYAADVRGILEDGATIIGGCCGTDPTYIAELAKLL